MYSGDRILETKDKNHLAEVLYEKIKYLNNQVKEIEHFLKYKNLAGVPIEFIG